MNTHSAQKKKYIEHSYPKKKKKHGTLNTSKGSNYENTIYLRSHLNRVSSRLTIPYLLYLRKFENTKHLKFHVNSTLSSETFLVKRVLGCLIVIDKMNWDTKWRMQKQLPILLQKSYKFT